MIDEGAATALLTNGRSLLPAGIIAINGSFERGDTICIEGPDRKELARGIARYSSNDLHQIAGLHSDQIEARLGFGYGPVVVHRNDLILL